MPFPFEKLLAYQRAVEWYREINFLLKINVKQISYGFSDQLRRLFDNARIAGGSADRKAPPARRPRPRSPSF